MRHVARHITSWFEPKQLGAIVLATLGVLGTRHEAGMNTRHEDERVSAVAELSAEAAAEADSLSIEVRSLKAQLLALRRSARRAGIVPALAEGAPEAGQRPAKKPGIVMRVWNWLPFHGRGGG